MNTSSLYSIPAGETPIWADGIPAFGWVLATHPDFPLPPDETSDIARHVIHCAPGTEAPANVVAVVVRGHITPWTPEAMVQVWPNGHKYIMDATWLGNVPGIGEIQVRGKIVQIPDGVTPIQTLLVPHEWAGDGAGVATELVE